MVFNGLKGADLITFNYLYEADLSNPITIAEIADKASYHRNTISFSLKRLEEWKLIEREREKIGQAYRYRIIGGCYDFPHS